MLAVVFGGSGFLGSHVADALLDKGFRVRIFDLQKSPYLRASQEMVLGDILDPESIRNAVAGADYVYNFAAIADIDQANRFPIDTVRINVLGNAMILEACRNERIKRYIYASTVYVYSQSGGFYRCSKQAAELYIEMYQQQFGLPYTILRYGSLYGPRADRNNGVRRCLEQAVLDNRIVYPGHGDELREYIHVQDAARSSVEILNPEFENDYAVLTGYQPMNVRALFDMIQEILNKKIEVVFAPPDSNVHYKITPYNFHPKLGKKLISKYYFDMGQGLLACLGEIYEKEVISSPGDIKSSRDVN